VIDLLTTLSCDPQNEVNQDANKALQELVACLDAEERSVTVKHITNCLHGQEQLLKKCLGLYREEGLERCLALLNGQLSLLSRLSAAPLAPVQLAAVVRGLTKASQLEDEGTVLVNSGGFEDFASLDFLFLPHLYLSCQRPSKSFRHLTSPRLIMLISSVCKSLAKADFYSLLELLIEGLQLESWRREVLWLLGRVVDGAKDEEIVQEGVVEGLKKVLHVLLKDNSGIKEGALQEFKGQGAVVKEEWTAELLSLECMGMIAKSLGHRLGHDLGPLILHALHTTDVTDRLAAHTLYFALTDISEGQGMNIPELLASIVSHLARDLNLALRTPGVVARPGLGTLIRVVLRMAGEEQAQSDMQDTIEVLLLHLAQSDASATQDILNTVKVFVFGVREKILLRKEDQVDEEDEEAKKKGTVTRMILELEEERRADEKADEDILAAVNCPSEGFHVEEAGAESMKEEEVEEETDPVLNADQTFLKVVVEHVRHFVSMSGQPGWQLAALASLTCSLDLLASTPGQQPGQRQTLLLPLVHQAWQPLKLLFRSTNIFIVDEAFKCLVVMANCARDFIRRRTLTDVLPPLLTFFKTLQVMVTDRDKQATLAATQSRRILNRLETGVWDLLHLLDLGPLDTDPIIQLLVDHLGGKLQDASSPAFTLKPKRNIDANILWLKIEHRSTN